MTKNRIWAFSLLDPVVKTGGDYIFEGRIVARFEKISGLHRYVVEDDRGILHIYNEKNLKLLKDTEDE